MRIIAGERRGARLAAPAGTATRPTGDRAREALFAMLGDVAGLRVLDAFAGSGALGLEALSRGAAHATFWETSADALRAVRANVAALDYEDRSTVRRTDARRRMASEAAQDAAYDLILLDPPYRMLAALQPAFSLHLPELLVPVGLAVVEGPAASEPLDLGLTVDTSRRYGDERLTIYRNG
jgi:16S rRNA (guanine966-N2)-methyltransferase